MIITVGTLPFEGPYPNTLPFRSRSGLWALHCRREDVLHRIDVAQFIVDPELVARFGVASRLLAERKFDVEHVNDRICLALNLTDK